MVKGEEELMVEAGAEVDGKQQERGVERPYARRYRRCAVQERGRRNDVRGAA